MTEINRPVLKRHALYNRPVISRFEKLIPRSSVTHADLFVKIDVFFRINIRKKISISYINIYMRVEFIIEIFI